MERWRTIIEPFRIKSVEPIRMTTAEERAATLAFLTLGLAQTRIETDPVPEPWQSPEGIPIRSLWEPFINDMQKETGLKVNAVSGPTPGTVISRRRRISLGGLFAALMLGGLIIFIWTTLKFGARNEPLLVTEAVVPEHMPLPKAVMTTLFSLLGLLIFAHLLVQSATGIALRLGVSEMLIGMILENKVLDVIESKAKISEGWLEFDRVVAGAGPLFFDSHLPIPTREFVRVLRGIFPFSTQEGEVDRLLIIVAREETRAE